MNAKDEILGAGLFFGPERISEITMRVTEKRYEKIWAGIEETAIRISAAKSLILEGDTFTIWYYARNRLMDLALYVLLTKNAGAAEALNTILLDLCSRDIDFWQGPHYPNRPRTIVHEGETLLAGELETAQLAMGISVAYDWAYAELRDEVKAAVERCLNDTARTLLRNSVRFQSERWVMNHLCVISTGLVLTSLALRRKGLPYEEDIRLASRGLDLWMEKIEFDGSYGESYHYWAYPVNCLFFGLSALKTVLGKELRNTHRMEKCFDWALFNQVGKYNVEGFDRPVAVAVNNYDCPFLFQMEAPESLLYSEFFRNPLAQWYTDVFLLENPPRPDCLSHVWHTCNSILLALDDRTTAPLSPAERSLPEAAYYADTGFVYIRDSWERCGEVGGDTVLSLQSGGGGRSCSHEHYDKNSFSLYAKGEYFICDPGHSCYRGDSHKTYDTSTAAHNTVTLDGGNQALSFLERGMLHDEAKANTSYDNQAVIVGKNFRKEISYIASEARRCYDPPLRRFTRHVWYVRPSFFLLWDRIDVGDVVGKARSGFNINNYDGRTVIERNGGGLFVRRPLADLQILYIHPEAPEFSESPGRLHMAYHILPDQKVEGKPGSAIRFEVSSKEPLNSFDHLYLLCPRDKGAQAATVEVQAVKASKGGGLFDEIAFSVTCDGKASNFTLAADGCEYIGATGSRYRF